VRSQDSLEQNRTGRGPGGVASCKDRVNEARAQRLHPFAIRGGIVDGIKVFFPCNHHRDFHARGRAVNAVDGRSKKRILAAAGVSSGRGVCQLHFIFAVRVVDALRQALRTLVNVCQLALIVEIVPVCHRKGSTEIAIIESLGGQRDPFLEYGKDVGRPPERPNLAYIYADTHFGSLAYGICSIVGHKPNV